MISSKFYYRIYYLLLAVILLSSIYIKFYFVTDIFTEYDDIGVVTLFKGFLGIKEINLNFFLLKEKIFLNQNFFSDFDNSFLLPLYIFWEWTYPPLQYLFYFFFNFDIDDIKLKIFLIRLPSIIFSLLSIFCYLILLNKLNFSKITKIVSLCFLAYSFNSNIYANHGSPYSAYIFGGFFGLLNLFNYYKRKSIKKPILINNLSLYLSYSNIILFLGFLLIEYEKKNLLNFFLELGKKYKIFILFNFFIFFPILLKFIFSNHKINMLNRSNYQDDNLSWYNELLVNLYPVFKFILIGFLNEKIFLIFIIFLVLFFFVKKKRDFKLNILSKISLLFFIIWIILSIFNILPLDETRHSLILLPFVLVIFSDIFEHALGDKKIMLLPTFLFMIISINSNIDILNSKKTNFNFEYFKNSNINIYTYGFTLEPYLMYDYKGKIFNTDLRSFKNNQLLKNIEDDELFLVSTLENLNEKFNKKEKFFLKLKNNYSINVLKEINSNITRSYNNVCCETTGKNNFYLYKLKRNE